MQRNEIVSETLNAKDQELAEATQNLEIARQRYDTQQIQIEEYRQIVGELQGALVSLIESGARRRIPKEIQLPSPVMKGSKGKVEGIVYPDEHGLVEICFNPAQNNVDPKSEVYVVSEFTGWKPERLELEARLDKPVFAKKFRLEPGYKYNFRFIVNESPVTDVSLAQLPNSGEQSYNYITVGRAEELMPGELTKQLSYVNPNVKEEERQVHRAKYFDLRASDRDKLMMDDLKKLEGKLFHKFTFPEGIFRLLRWDFGRYEASAMRLCDNFKVPLDLQDFRLDHIALEDLQTQYYAMGKAEEEVTERTLYANKIHIKYKAVTDVYEGDTYCEPIAVEPVNINVQDVVRFLPLVRYRL